MSARLSLCWCIPLAEMETIAYIHCTNGQAASETMYLSIMLLCNYVCMYGCVILSVDNSEYKYMEIIYATILCTVSAVLKRKKFSNITIRNSAQRDRFLTRSTAYCRSVVFTLKGGGCSICICILCIHVKHLRSPY